MAHRTFLLHSISTGTQIAEGIEFSDGRVAVHFRQTHGLPQIFANVKCLEIEHGKGRDGARAVLFEPTLEEVFARQEFRDSMREAKAEAVATTRFRVMHGVEFRCPWCELTKWFETQDKGVEFEREHVKLCELHPMRQLEEKVRRRESEIKADLQREGTFLGIPCSEWLEAHEKLTELTGLDNPRNAMAALEAKLSPTKRAHPVTDLRAVDRSNLKAFVHYATGPELDALTRTAENMRPATKSQQADVEAIRQVEP